MPLMLVFHTVAKMLPGIAALFFVAYRAAFGHGIITIPTKGMAAADAFCGQPSAFEAAVFCQSFQCIGRAGGLITAIKANPGAEDQPVGPHGQGKEMGQGGHGALIGAEAAQGNARRQYRALAVWRLVPVHFAQGVDQVALQLLKGALGGLIGAADQDIVPAGAAMAG